MKKIIAALLLLVAPALGFASSAGVHLEKANIDLHNKMSLQNGAKYFVNYCLSCHSANFMRYSRMAQDLGLSEKQVKQNLMFASEKIGSTMSIAMDPQDSKRWFGTTPPDLSVIARSRGADWLYTYLLTFYLDPSRPTGVNNLAFPDVGMPHVLWELQGWQEPVYRTHVDHEGHEHEVIDHLEVTTPGKMSEVEYRQAMRDLVAYLAYMGEPAKLKRQTVGFWVLLYLALFFVVAYFLKKAYWKDIH